MKQIKGYLLDKATGSGIAGKAVTFTKLDGSLVTSADTLAQATSAVTAGDGSFYGNFELSPGPINVQVDAGASEVKKRINDERAEFGYQWSSDISRFGRGMKGVVGGYMNELAVSIPAGHTIRIGTGAAIFNGNVFSIEMGPQDIAGTPNANAAIATRVDLVTLRQYSESAVGQLAGKQQIVVTLGTTTDVAPALPTGSDFIDFPLAEVATAYNASTKTVKTDLRVFTGDTRPAAAGSAKFNSGDFTGASTNLTSASNSTQATATITGLNPALVYDGEIEVHLNVSSSPANGSTSHLLTTWSNAAFLPSSVTDLEIMYWVNGDNMQGYYRIPISGLTGVSSLSVDLKYRGTSNVGGTSIYILRDVVGIQSTASRWSITLQPR